MSPEQTKVFLANVPKPKPAVPLTAVAIRQNPHLSPVKVGDFKKIVRSVPDPVQEQQIRKFNAALCVAYEGKPPGLARACSALSPTAITNVNPTAISHIGVISVEPSPLQFTPVSGGPQAATIANISKLQINIGTPSVGGTNATDFTIDSGCLRASLAPGATCKIGVRFRPRGTGQRTAQVDIRLSDGSRGAVVEITGPGLIP